MEGHAIPAHSAVQGLPWQNPSVVFSDGDIVKRHTEDKTVRACVKKAGKASASDLWYASGDSTRRDLAEAVRAMLQPRHCRLVAIGEAGKL